MLNNYTNATQLLEQGKAKEAYSAFMSVVELSTEQLRGVKFVHQTIVSKPSQYEDSIALLRSSLDQIEKIAISSQALPGATTTVTTRPTAVGAKSPPPPVPPKPSSVKPMIPPKPKEVDTTITKRSRGSSVSFADGLDLQQTAIIEGEELSILPQQAEEMIRHMTTTEEGPGQVDEGHIVEEEDDDDDDDVVIEFESAVKLAKRPSTTIAPSSSNILYTTHHSTLTQASASTLSTTTTASPVVGRPRGRSQSWVVQSDAQSKRDSIDVLLETIVDPNNLVKAQTNTGDSLSIPQQQQKENYVPNIPAPPLLATHRRLQHRLDELEQDVEECNNDLLKLERSHKVMCAKQTLEKVRTLYMSAMTIPNILQFPPHLMAYQLTLIESSIFRAIPSQALVSHSTRTPHKKIVASTDFFNFMTRSIEHSILLPQEATKRAEIIHRWIKIATKLLALNNYQTLKAIVSALGTPPIQRLRRTWECIPKKRMTRLDILNMLMSESDNYQKYREHIQHLWHKPVVPFLGVFIHDITYLSCSKNPLRVQEVLNEVQLFQRAPVYPLVPPASLMAAATKKKHSFLRPSSVLHFGSGTSGYYTSGIGGNKNTTAALMGEDVRQDTELELEQQLIVQYILMRPWVSEKTIDALSTLREPPKPRSISSHTTTSSSPANGVNGGGYYTSPNASRPSSGFMSNPSGSTVVTSGGSSGLTPMTPITINTSPVALSASNSSTGGGGSSFKGSSFMRFNNNHSNTSSSTQDISPTSTTHHPHYNGSNSSSSATAPDENKKSSSLGGFWPFNKKSSSTSTNTASASSDANTVVTPTEVYMPPYQEQKYSEEEEDDDDESEEQEEEAEEVEEEEEVEHVTGGSRFGHLLHHRHESKKSHNHNRSMSLPANKILIPDLYAK